MRAAGIRLLLVAVGITALGLVPVLAPPFYANLLVPFFAYAIALLGFNLLFGYTGLLSFGHAMYLGLGAYAAAVVAGVLGIRQFELVLLAATLAAIVVALPIGILCVRYTGIFFGMLTLAFGMLAHSFLFKFYHLTGGDSGMRVPRMRILGLEFDAYNKIELLAGPFYYYCLGLMVLAGLAYSAAVGGWNGLGQGLLGMCVGLATLMPLYAVGGMGAGDVKLMAGVGAWLGAQVTWNAFLVSAVVGGLMALVMVVYRKAWNKHYGNAMLILSEIVTVKDPRELSKIAAERKPHMLLLPYGIPICIGSIAYFLYAGMI